MTYPASDHIFAKILAVHDYGHDETDAGRVGRALASAFSESQMAVITAPYAADNFASINGNASLDHYGTDLPPGNIPFNLGETINDQDHESCGRPRIWKAARN